MSPALPRAVRPLAGFAALLRSNGFAVAPEQTIAFVAAVGLLDARSMEHIRRAAFATLAPQPEQRPLFDALFDAHFLGAAGEPGDADAWQPDEGMKLQEDGGVEAIEIGDEANETGAQATGAEALSMRALRPGDGGEALRRLSRDLPAALPRRRGHRLRPARRGAKIDPARSLKAAMRTEGEVMSLKRRRRKERARPLLLLIDVSGSMKQRTDANLALAHVVMQAAPRCEVFTFGTRLTRLTAPLRRRNRDEALARASALVADWDGGTRIGDALAAFLAVPRFAGYARGAVAVVLSDGLERGDPAAMIGAVRRLARLAHRIDWLSPLAGEPGYRPETEALAAVRPLLASLGSGASTAAVSSRLLSLADRQAA
jgi:hypothetical protein